MNVLVHVWNLLLLLKILISPKTTGVPYTEQNHLTQAMAGVSYTEHPKNEGK